MGITSFIILGFGSRVKTNFHFSFTVQKENKILEKRLVVNKQNRIFRMPLI